MIYFLVYEKKNHLRRVILWLERGILWLELCVAIHTKLIAKVRLKPFHHFEGWWPAAYSMRPAKINFHFLSELPASLDPSILLGVRRKSFLRWYASLAQQGFEPKWANSYYLDNSGNNEGFFPLPKVDRQPGNLAYFYEFFWFGL